MTISSFQPDRLDQFVIWTIDKIGDDSLIEAVANIADMIFQMGLDWIVTGPLIGIAIGIPVVSAAVATGVALTAFWILLNRYCKRAKID